MNNKVTSLQVIRKDSNIFSNIQYIIPLYQRGYAWEEKHIVQLIDDIMDVPDNSLYYIGSLIVHHRTNAFEVIDGQQRLTTLFLLLKFLDELKPADNKALLFDCRDKSNYTLNHLQDITSGASQELIDDNRIQNELIDGFCIIKDRLKSENLTALKEKLSRTVLYRIEVPDHTDLNHYFEIMNTRGEQLEQSDVLKAQLMSKLQGNKKWQSIFDYIWDACRNMNGYVQMHFPKNLRDEIFGMCWNDVPDQRLGLSQALSIDSKVSDGHNIKEAIESNFKTISNKSNTENYQKDRFESIIDFPYFLLHTLRIFVHTAQIKSQPNYKGYLIDTMLDDKKLVEAFDRVMTKGVFKDKPIDMESFVKKFVVCLLRTRVLFDKYIIKREYIGEASLDGEWSLKEICSTGQGRNKKPMYKLTKVVGDGQWYNQEYNEEVKMLQAAMRVSYTSPKAMHWITELLTWLTDYFSGQTKENWNYVEIINKIAKKPVIEFLKDEHNLHLGVATPHIVLNYLDYLLWQNDKSVNFNFEFRNSVEHWYPQNPSEGSFPRWEDNGAEGVNRFGNLCLIQRNVNSKFSNLHPSAKKSTFQEMINKGSLKLRKMSELTDDSLRWKDETCAKHEEEMLNLLKQAIWEEM